MAEKKKIIRLADVGELENILKKDLAEEEAKGKDADTLFCEDVAGELTDLKSLPTIDPESLRGHAKWVKDKELKFIIVDDEKKQSRGTGNLLHPLQGQNLAKRF